MARNVERDIKFREKQRSIIMEKASQLFALRGLQGVRIQDIAKAVGITPANVYHYFKSKEDLLVEIVFQSQLEFREELERMINDDSTPWNKLISIGVSGGGDRKSHLIMLHLSMALSDAMPEQRKQQFKANGMENLNILSSIIAEGQRQGQIKNGEPMQLAARFIMSLSGFNVYCATHLYEGIEFSFEDIIADLKP